MSPAVALAQAAQQGSPETGATVLAVLAAFLVSLVFAAHFRGGVGCTGLAALVLVPASFIISPAAGMRTLVILALPIGFVWHSRRTAREEEVSRARAWEEKVRAQRASIRGDATLVARAQYRGGIAELAPGHEVDVYVHDRAMWLAPADGATPVARLDVGRVAALRVVDATAGVVLALERRHGRNQEVELGTAPGGPATARQLYAVLDAALPSAAGAVPELLPAVAAPAVVCAGCGAGVAGGAARCPYCGRPL